MSYNLTKLDEARVALIVDALDNLCEGEIVGLWSEYQRENRYEDELFDMSELDDYFAGCGATEILDRVCNGFSTNAEYFRYTIYGLESVDYYDDVVDLDELAKWIYDTGDAHRISGLKDVLERFDDEDDLAERIAKAVYDFDPYIGLTKEEIEEGHKLDFTSGKHKDVAEGLRAFAAQYEDDEDADVSEFIELAEEVEGLA